MGSVARWRSRRPASALASSCTGAMSASSKLFTTRSSGWRARYALRSPFSISPAPMPQAYETLSDSLAAEFGRLDGLVHNAAMLGERFSIEQYDAVMWQRVLHVNLTAAFALTQVCMPLLRAAPDPLCHIYEQRRRPNRAGVLGRLCGVQVRDRRSFSGARRRTSARRAARQLRESGSDAHDLRLAAYPAEDRDRLKRPDEVLATYLYLFGPDSRGVTGRSLDYQ